jgi:hypothetical protein
MFFGTSEDMFQTYLLQVLLIISIPKKKIIIILQCFCVDIYIQLDY